MSILKKMIYMVDLQQSTSLSLTRFRIPLRIVGLEVSRSLCLQQLHHAYVIRLFFPLAPPLCWYLNIPFLCHRQNRQLRKCQKMPTHHGICPKENIMCFQYNRIQYVEWEVVVSDGFGIYGEDARQLSSNGFAYLRFRSMGGICPLNESIWMIKLDRRSKNM